MYNNVTQVRQKEIVCPNQACERSELRKLNWKAYVLTPAK